MTFDAFEAAINALPSAKLAALGREIDAQIAELQDQGQKVRRVLGERQTDDGSRNRSPSTGTRRRKPGTGKRRRAFIKKVIDAEPGKRWLPVDLEAQFRESGDPATRDSIRNIVRDMIADGEIARHPSGNGATALSGLASANGSTQESLTEAQT